MCVGDSTAAKAAFEKRQGRVGVYHTQCTVVASWMVGKPKQVASCQPPTPPCRPCPSRGQLVATQEPPVSPTSRHGPFPLCKQTERTLTHWACQELVLRWLPAERRAHSCCRRGLFLNRIEQQEGAASMRKVITQTTWAAVRIQLGWLLHSPDS